MLAYAPQTTDTEVAPFNIAPCDKLGCHNQGNGKECWTVTHDDGTRSFEWPSEGSARCATLLTPAGLEQAGLRRHLFSFC